MLKQIRILSRIEFCNFFNLNVMFHGRNRKEKWKGVGIAAAYLLLLAMLEFYIVLMSYSLIQIGIGDIIPVYLIVIASVVILVFSILKTGGTIFRRNGYDVLSSLPVSQQAIVISRFLRVYAEEALTALIVMLPGLAVYAWFLHPGVGFYVVGFLSIWIIPMIPTAAACVIGTAVTAIASRMKHKALAEMIIMMFFVVGVLAFSFLLPQGDQEITPAMLMDLAGLINSLVLGIYPPAFWMGKAINTGSILSFLPGALLSLLLFFAAAAVIAAKFHEICRRLYSTTAKHDYQMKKLESNSVRQALIWRERKRYFASSVYVVNTIIGPVMGLAFGVSLLFFDPDELAVILELPLDIQKLIPFLIAGIFSVMNLTSVSISMEGKEWWIAKSLPLSTKEILDAKLLFGLFVPAPFFLLAEICILAALRPQGTDLLWTILIPAVLILFSNILGITMNLLLPKMNWESEASVVKQSASAALGGMSGMLIAVLLALPIVFLPELNADLICAAECVILASAAAVLYYRNNRVDLRNI